MSNFSGKTKCARSSSVNIIIARLHPSSLTYLEEHWALFDQGHHLLEYVICHHEFFFATTTDKPSNFGKAFKGTDWVNWIKGAFAKYYKNSTFSLFNAPSPRSNLPSTTRVLQSILDPVIKNISDNIYQYFTHHWANGGTLVKGIDFDLS